MSVRHVVIVGTGHSYHVPPTGPAADEFRAFLGKICNAHQVQAIAEELSQEALAKTWKYAKSLCHDLADAIGVSHRYCDLDTAQRSAVGVRGPQEDQLNGIYTLKNQKSSMHFNLCSCLKASRHCRKAA